MDFNETMKLLDEMIRDMKVKEKSDTKILRDNSKLAINAKCEITEAFVDVMQKYAEISHLKMCWTSVLACQS